MSEVWPCPLSTSFSYTLYELYDIVIYLDKTEYEHEYSRYYSDINNTVYAHEYSINNTDIIRSAMIAIHSDSIYHISLFVYQYQP